MSAVDPRNRFRDGKVADLNHAQFALGQINELDLLHGHSLAGIPVEGFVDGPKRSLA